MKTYSYRVTNLAVARDVVTTLLTSRGYRVTWTGDEGLARRGRKFHAVRTVGSRPYSELGLLLTNSARPVVHVEQRCNEDMTILANNLLSAISAAGITFIGNSEGLVGAAVPRWHDADTPRPAVSARSYPVAIPAHDLARWV
jgi:hypothetical protein